MDFNRELIVYAIFTALLWMVSLTCLLPFVVVIKFSKTYRNMWFSWFYVKLCEPRLNRAMTKMRKQAFSRLKDHLGDRKRNTPLEILEIGIGGGANLPYYPKNTSLTVVDMNPTFMTYFEGNLQKYPHVNLKRTVITMAEDMHEIDDGSFDVVICTYTACAFVDLKAVFAEIKRVLKPGGKFLCLEHNPYPRSSWVFTLQKLASPLWKIYFNGCILTRKIDDEIRNTGFTYVVIDQHHPKEMMLFFRSHIVGIATK